MCKSDFTVTLLTCNRVLLTYNRKTILFLCFMLREAMEQAYLGVLERWISVLWTLLSVVQVMRVQKHSSCVYSEVKTPVKSILIFCWTKSGQKVDAEKVHGKKLPIIHSNQGVHNVTVLLEYYQKTHLNSLWKPQKCI